MEDITEHHDIVIIGAGLSGINAAHGLQDQLPHRKLTILEGRDVIGGTWSFFKYPGFRCDSMMTNFGFKWYPWPHENKIARGPQILEYLKSAATASGIMDSIRLSHRVTRLEWREDPGVWRVTVSHDGVEAVHSAKFVFSCTGYYSYRKAQDTVIPGIENFKGTTVHPQWWPEDLDYEGKRVIVIGSGATTVTLIPSMAPKVAHITMLQRSPTYMASLPAKRTATDNLIRFLFAASFASWLSWWKDMFFECLFTIFLLNFPNVSRKLLMGRVAKQVPKDIDVSVHFNPRYRIRTQRICLAPDGDFFQALHRDNVQIVTGVIDQVTSSGIRLKSGQEIAADIIVTATGLHVQVIDGMQPIVDGKTLDVGSQYTWRGCMLESTPNMGFVLGYPVQSWTPGADLTTQMIVRVIKSMERKGATKVVPVIQRYKGMPEQPSLAYVTSNYFLNALPRIPKVTGESPWYGRTHWVRDKWLSLSSIEEGLLFSRTGKKAASLSKKCG